MHLVAIFSKLMSEEDLRGTILCNASVFGGTHVTEIAVWPHKHRGEVSESQMVRTVRQIDVFDGVCVGRCFPIRGQLQPEPTTILEQARERRVQAPFEREVYVRKAMPTHSLAMLPAVRRWKKRLRIGYAKAGDLF